MQANFLILSAWYYQCNERVWSLMPMPQEPINTVSEKIIFGVSSIFWHRKNKTLVRAQHRIHKWNSCHKSSDYLTNSPSFSKIAIFHCGQTIELNGNVRRIFVLRSFFSWWHQSLWLFFTFYFEKSGYI